MRRDLLQFDLPDELIATHPAAERDGARLLVVDPVAGLTHTTIRELEHVVEPGSLLVVNDTQVIPARLLGHKAGSGGKTEILLVRKLGERPSSAMPASPAGPGDEASIERWAALGRSSKPLRVGSRVAFGPEGSSEEALVAEIAGKSAEDGLLEVQLSTPSGRSVSSALRKLGHMPLPPYIRRPDTDVDRERYQTVFARNPGAVAAPTAGLHLTKAMLSRLEQQGTEIATVTLHVGLGTFQPVAAADLDDHPMHAETFTVSEQVAAAVERARSRKAKVVAVGTTVVRALESAADPVQRGFVRPASAETRILIQPGYQFRVVDELLTNFHLPESTLLALACALGGRDRILDAYRAAVAARYRFYSYGDAMFIRGPHT